MCPPLATAVSVGSGVSVCPPTRTAACRSSVQSLCQANRNRQAAPVRGADGPPQHLAIAARWRVGVKPCPAEEWSSGPGTSTSVRCGRRADRAFLPRIRESAPGWSGFVDEATGQEADHREPNHGLEMGRPGLVRPNDKAGREILGYRIAADGLDGSPQAGLHLVEHSVFVGRFASGRAFDPSLEGAAFTDVALVREEVRPELLAGRMLS